MSDSGCAPAAAQAQRASWRTLSGLSFHELCAARRANPRRARKDQVVLFLAEKLEHGS